MGRFVQATEALMDYLSRTGAREHPAQTRCREETSRLGRVAQMQIAPEQGAFLALMAKLIGARRCLEVGTFTGYSALSVALALPAGGRILALDVSKDYTDRARGYWREAGVEDRIDLRLGPGVESLDALIAANAEPFDFVFIDADKAGIPDYYRHAVQLSRPGTVIVTDNVIRKGAVLDANSEDASVRGVRRFNELVAADPRVTSTTIQTVGEKGYDGFTLTLVHH
jgi:predicted O-methyltransferase YrrM